MKFNNITVRKIVMTGLIAALYAVATVALPFASYNAIQFRFSEVLTLMAFIDPAYIPGLVLGCIIANLFSPLGIVDVVVGTTATFISVFLISKTKRLFIATLWPAIFNSVIIGAELYFISHQPFWLSSFQVGIGEFVVVTCIGYPLFKYVISRKNIAKYLKISNFINS